MDSEIINNKRLGIGNAMECKKREKKKTFKICILSLLFIFNLFDMMKTVDYISDSPGMFLYFSGKKYGCHRLVLKYEELNKYGCTSKVYPIKV